MVKGQGLGSQLELGAQCCQMPEEELLGHKTFSWHTALEVLGCGVKVGWAQVSGNHGGFC